MILICSVKKLFFNQLINENHSGKLALDFLKLETILKQHENLKKKKKERKNCPATRSNDQSRSDKTS